MKCELLSNNQLIYYCEGCKHLHSVDADRWSWNKNEENPTLKPSVLHSFPNGDRCHYFMMNGKMRFLNDCTHECLGKVVQMRNYKENI